MLDDTSAIESKKIEPAITTHSDGSGFRFYVIGCLGHEITIKADDEDTIYDETVDKTIYFESISRLPLGPVSLAVPALGLSTDLKIIDSIFSNKVDTLLIKKSSSLINTENFSSFPLIGEGRELIDARIRSLYISNINKDADIEYCNEHQSEILIWYVNDWTMTGACSGRVCLNDLQISYLQENAMEQDLVGYKVNRHMFHFSRKYNLLNKALHSIEGLTQTYLDFLLTDSYKKLVDIPLIPLNVLNLLSEPTYSKGITLNRFWVHVIENELGTRKIADLSQLELISICAEKFSYSLLNRFFVELLPSDWFRMYKAGFSEKKTALRDIEKISPSDSKLEGNPKLDQSTRRRVVNRTEAVLKVLRDSSLDEIFGRGWSLLILDHELLHDNKAQKNDLTMVGHVGNSGLAKNMMMFRNAFEESHSVSRTTKANGMTVIDLSAKAPENGPSKKINIFAINANRYGQAMAELASSQGNEIVNIGFFLWETTKAPSEHRQVIDMVDEIWTPSEFVKNIYVDLFEDRINVVNIRKHISVPKEINKFAFGNLGIKPDDFVFLNISDFDSSITRKNPLPVVQAFRKAFPDNPNVRLVLKVRRIDTSHWSNTDNYWRKVQDAIDYDERITILTGDLPEQEYWELLQSSDCYVTLHRSEGFGYGASHAMLLKVPVITTDFSGTQDFCTDETAFLVPGEEVPVRLGAMGFREPLGNWAEADVDVAVSQMLSVYQDSATVERRVNAARHKIETEYSLDVFRNTIQRRIETLRGERS